MPTPLKLQVEELQNSTATLSDRDRSFALSLCSQFWSRGLSEKQQPWVSRLLDKARGIEPEKKTAKVGDLSGLMAMFDHAKKHLKYPAVVLDVSLSTRPIAIRISVAGERARFPGSLSVTSQEKDPATGKRAWLGRVQKDGTFEASDGRDLGNTDPQWADKVGAKLVALAGDPAKVASDHGKLTGCCCFCNHVLEDPRSTSVGYGPICAGHFGVPWGKVEGFVS